MASRSLKKILLRAVLVVVLCGFGYGLAKLPALVLERSLRRDIRASRRAAGPQSADRLPAGKMTRPDRSAEAATCGAPPAAASEAGPTAARPVRQPPETARASENRDLYEALAAVSDPEIPLSVVELGLIRHIERTADGAITVTMILTSPLCPYLKELVAGIREAVQPFAPGRKVQVEIDFSRPWSPADLSPEGRRKLFGATP